MRNSWSNGASVSGGVASGKIVAWVERMSHARFLDLVRSRSYFITASAAAQAATIAALETLFATHPQLAGAEELAVPYLTRCFRTRLR